MAGSLLKVGLACLLFVLVLFTVLLPVCFFRRRRRSAADPSQQSQPSADGLQRSAWAGRISVLAAGALLTVGLLDMFPDAAQQLAPIGLASRRLAHSLALAGLAAVLVIDRIASARCSRAALLATALSVHSLFEGLALGVAPQPAKLAAYFTAIVLHKLVVAASLGIELAVSSASIRSILTCAAGFALASPAGLTLRLLLTTNLDAQPARLTGGVLQSFASGTFLYVALFEILPREFGYDTADTDDVRDVSVNQNAQTEAPSRRTDKLIFMVLGFTAVSAYEILERMLLTKSEDGGGR